MRLKSVIRVSMYIRELMTLTQCTADAERDVGMKKLKLEEAITILQDMKVDIPVPKAAVMQTKRNVALDMAIDALKCSEMPNSSQCISRQAAIAVANSSDYVGLSVEDVKKVTDEVVKGLMQLPSAQPDFDITVKIDKAYDDGYEAGYLQGRHDWGDLDG